MLVLNPRVVIFDGETIGEVSLIAIDRSAENEVVEWSDLGPFVALADVPEVLTEVRMVQRLGTEDLGSLVPGVMGELVFYTSRSSGDTLRRRISMDAVLMDVKHELNVDRGTHRVFRFVAVSEDGSSDPVVVEDAAFTGV
ncbi:MAG: hypothetical protein H6815_05310 [Phycisphaeraceae bacterium]|nr:hypothetical protein [Phycisphaerales bacterium]MCB9859855.1 hypothetical protein [Phycisphaeraceae bacterium]